MAGVAIKASASLTVAARSNAPEPRLTILLFAHMRALTFRAQPFRTHCSARALTNN